MANNDTATQYRWAAEDLEIDLKEQQRELRGAEAIRASEQAQLKRLQDQRQLAILPADRARLDNSIELAQRRVARSNSEVEQIGQKVAETQQGINYNREEERKALGGPPAANNVPPPGPAAVPPPNPTPLNATQQAAQPPLATPVNPSPAPVTPAQRGDNGGFVTNAQGELVPSDSSEAEEIRAEQNRIQELNAAPQREFVYDPETGEMVASDSDQALALREEASREENRARFANAEPQPEFVYDEVTGEMVPGDSGRAAEIRAEQAPGPVPPTLSAVWDSESGSWGVWADPPGEIQQSGFATEAEATAAAGDQFEALRLQREAELGEEQPAVFGPEPVAPSYTAIWDSETGSYGIWEDPPGVFRETGFATEEEAQRAIANIAPDVDLPTPPDDGLTDEERAERDEAAAQAAAKEAAINQATRQSVYKQAGSSDWRVRLQLAPTSNYLYNAEPAGILKPLFNTNGVIFPYTPQIQTTYQAKYTDYDLVHSNFRGVFYQSSRVDDINIRAEFTAQDTNEADYLLAVIHFFRSVTKMFYGKDAQRGSPPPLVYLSGLGMNQFYGHPCLVRSFNYSLPNNVDYIRATNVNNYGTDLLNRRTASAPSSAAGLGATGNRILNAGLEKFFPSNKPAPNPVVGTVNNTQLANYVPTKMEIDIVLIPVQTRSQASKQFSLGGFANGDLIKGGFW